MRKLGSAFLFVPIVVMLLGVLGCENDPSVNADADATACISYLDCPIGQECIANTCRPIGGDDENILEVDVPWDQSTDTPPIACITYMDCPVGYDCVDLFCVKVVGDEDPLSEEDPEMERADDPASQLCTPCSSDDECGRRADHCLPDDSGNMFCGMACANDIECPHGYTCSILPNDGQCQPSTGRCETGPDCGLTGCEDGQVCDPFAGACVPDCRMAGCSGGAICNPTSGLCEGGGGGFCDACETDEDCGGVNDLCMPDAGGSTFCGTDCSGGTGCEMIDSFCRRLDADHYQCWPINNDCSGVGPDCTTTGCPAGQVCNPNTGHCEQQSSDCRQTGCQPGFTCNTMTGQCQPDSSDDCTITGCERGYTCNYFTGLCEPETSGCTSDFDCPSGYRCNSFTGQCEPDNTGQSCLYTGCPPGLVCDWLSETCEQEYCLPCQSSSDCNDFFSECHNGGCAPQCESNAQCPSGSQCTDPTGWGFFNYCIPLSGSCSGVGDLDTDTTEQEQTDPCDGVTYEGECRGNDLYWCDSSTGSPRLGIQTCSETNAQCSFYSAEIGYLCLGVEGAQCDPTDDFKSCYPGYDCVNATCTGSGGDPDLEPEPELEPDLVEELPADQDVVEDEEVEPELDPEPEVIDETEDGLGGPGDPCPNGFGDCDPVTTDICLTNSDGSSTLCSIDCATDTDCRTGGFPDGCCIRLTGGDMACVGADLGLCDGGAAPGEHCVEPADCNSATTDGCLTFDGEPERNFCTYGCTTGADCETDFPGGCCEPVGDAGLYCQISAECTGSGGAGSCAEPIAIGSLPYTYSGTTSGTSLYNGEGCSGIPHGDGPESFHSIVMTAGQQISITASASDFDVVLFVSDACAGGATVCEATDTYASFPEETTFLATTAGTYYIVVDGYWSDESGNFELTVE